MYTLNFQLTNREQEVLHLVAEDILIAELHSHWLLALVRSTGI
jgi:hypothetical protein